MGTELATPLAEMAKQINEAHAACEAAKEDMVADANDSIQQGLKAGRLLLEVKEQLPHGGFGDWVEANFDGSYRTARVYMQVAKRWPEVHAKWLTSAKTSLQGALKQLAPPKVKTPTEKPAAVVPSIEESNRLQLWRIEMGVALGALLQAAEVNGVKNVGEFAWMCPNSDKLTDKGRHKLLRDMATRWHKSTHEMARFCGIPSAITSQGMLTLLTRRFMEIPDWPHPVIDWESVDEDELQEWLAAPFSGSIPGLQGYTATEIDWDDPDDGPSRIVWWFDVAIAAAKFANGTNQERICLSCPDRRAECVFGM